MRCLQNERDDAELAPDMSWAFVLQDWLCDFSKLVEAREKVDSNAAKARDRKYISDAALGGARKLHQATRPLQTWHVEPAAKQGDNADPLSIVDGKLMEWMPIWNATRSKDQYAPLPLDGPWMHDAEGDEALPEVPPEEMLRATGGFKKHTGLGVDTHHPLTWTQHGLEAATPSAAAMRQAEMEMRWPLMVAWVLIFLLDKPDGGQRPIGLLSTTVRIWENSRMPLMLKWRLTHDRPYDFAAAGRHAEAAVWLQALAEEALPNDKHLPAADQQARLSIVLDLVKCFDTVKLVHLWTWGCYWGVPRRLLRMMCITFSQPRRLVYRGSASAAVLSVGSIIAGSKFAIDCLHILLIWPMDALLRLFPMIEATKYVDDLTIVSQGSAAAVTDAALQAFD